MNAQPAILSLGVLAAFALVVGGGWLIARRQDGKRAILMIVAAVVLMANVLLWAWPMPAHAGAALPPDIRAYAARRAGCDGGRRASAHMPGTGNGCHGLADERRRLRQRYRGNPQLLRHVRFDEAR